MATFDPVTGHEQGGVRPALVVSVDIQNAVPARLVALAPLTTRDRGVPLHVRVLPPEGGVDRPSFVLCDHLRFASQTRLHLRLGAVEPPTLWAVEGILRRLMSL
jgi:mRNA interferase MazF